MYYIKCMELLLSIIRDVQTKWHQNLKERKRPYPTVEIRKKWHLPLNKNIPSNKIWSLLCRGVTGIPTQTTRQAGCENSLKLLHLTFVNNTATIQMWSDVVVAFLGHRNFIIIGFEDTGQHSQVELAGGRPFK